MVNKKEKQHIIITMVIMKQESIEMVKFMVRHYTTTKMEKSKIDIITMVKKSTKIILSDLFQIIVNIKIFIYI